VRAMNIIALSLGLAPVPPTPSQLRREAIRARAARGHSGTRRAVTEITDGLLEMLRRRDHITLEDAMADLQITRSMAANQLAMLIDAGCATRHREATTDGRRVHVWRIAEDDPEETRP